MQYCISLYSYLFQYIKHEFILLYLWEKEHPLPRGNNNELKILTQKGSQVTMARLSNLHSSLWDGENEV